MPSVRGEAKGEFLILLLFIQQPFLGCSTGPPTGLKCMKRVCVDFLRYTKIRTPEKLIPSHIHLYKFDKGGNKAAHKGGDKGDRKAGDKAVVKVVIPELNVTNNTNLINVINDLN